MDVIIGVTDSDPAHRRLVPARGDPDPVQELRRDLGPLVVGQRPVGVSRRQRQVIHRPGRLPLGPVQPGQQQRGVQG